MANGNQLRNRLRTLALLELANIGIIGWTLFGAFGAPMSPANIAGFTLTAMHLVVGSAYWAAKLVQVDRGLELPPGAQLLRPLRLLLIAALGVGEGVLAVAVATAPIVHWLAGSVLLALAVAEHVNYFHWQLMYDNRTDLGRLLRTGRLARPHLRTDAMAALRRGANRT